MQEAAKAVKLNPLAVLSPAKPLRLYTLEDYLRREEKSPERHEYFDGILKKVPIAKGPHNEIAVNIATAIKIAVKSANKKYRIYGSNQKLYLPNQNYGLYPDAVVICEQPQFWDKGQLLLTNPLVIIEILSKSTRAYDRSGKFDHYKTIPSFREYVLVEQNECRVETRFREEPDLWRDAVIKGINERVYLRSIHCSISMSDIYENIEFK
jgi:Uma2 family endonuclease